MEWVETTGTTIDEARLRALDTLGVAFDDAEIEIVAEPNKSLFGLRRTEARVRARVKPVQPRPKVERRDRGRRKSGERSGHARGGSGRGRRSDSKGSGGQGDGGDARDDRSTEERADGDGSRRKTRSGAAGADDDRRDKSSREQEGRPKGRRQKAEGSDRQDTARGSSDDKEQVTMNDNDSDTEVVDAAGQAAIVEEFLDGLLDAFDADGELESVQLDDETYEVRVHGDQLGLLIGPKGATMQAVQEIARTAVQQQTDGGLTGRVHLDIGGYRTKRREALAEFATRVAESVKASGEPKVLEPMPAPDRKVVHDTVAEIDGVESTSEGADNRRHIVLSPTD